MSSPSERVAHCLRKMQMQAAPKVLGSMKCTQHLAKGRNAISGLMQV